MIDFTIVLGVDLKHLEQLELVWPTWKKFKPSLLTHPFFIFYDYSQTTSYAIRKIIGNDCQFLTTIPWPPYGINHHGDPRDKWTNPQRYKMLSGFVHTPGRYIKTEYWLKLDTDTVAIDCDDWIDQSWFDSSPAIVSHPWGYTKPPYQMALLDQWVKHNEFQLTELVGTYPLNLFPSEGSNCLPHKRIISWCGFFNTEFTSFCSRIAQRTVGPGLLPCYSQDGYMWYMAERMKKGIVRTNMKNRGWAHLSTTSGIRKKVQEVMEGNGG